MQSIYNDGGYSEFMLIRLKQLSKFGIYYGITNLIQFLLAFIVLFVFTANEDVYSCFNECAMPLNNWGGLVIFARKYMQLI